MKYPHKHNNNRKDNSPIEQKGVGGMRKTVMYRHTHWDIKHLKMLLDRNNKLCGVSVGVCSECITKNKKKHPVEYKLCKGCYTVKITIEKLTAR